MLLRTLAAILFILILGCSSTQKNDQDLYKVYPPEVANSPINRNLFSNKDFESIDIFLNRIMREQNDDATRWWADYRRAQLWQQKDIHVSCENFARLAAEAAFPLRRLAYLQAHALCPKDNKILSRLEDFDKESFDPWLDRMALDVAISKARKQNNRKDLIDYLLKKSKLPLRKDEKVAYTQEALKWAKRIRDKKQIALLTKRLRRLSPSRNSRPHWSQYLRVANDYRFRRHFQMARKYYRKVIAHRSYGLYDKLSAYRGIKSAYKIEGKKIKSLDATRDLAIFVERHHKRRYKRRRFSNHDLLSAYMQLSRAYWTLGKRSKAWNILNKAEKRLAGKISIHEVHWIRGRMAEEKQAFKTANDMYEMALQENKISENFENLILWNHAWSFRKRGMFKQAESVLEKIKDREENTFKKMRYWYWYARTLKDLGEDSDAEDEFEDLIEHDPINYYSFIAHRDLNKPLKTRNVERDLASFTGKDISIPRDLRPHFYKSYMEWLISVGEQEVARDYLRHVVKRYKSTKRNRIASWRTLFQYYARSGNFQSLFDQLYALDTKTRKTIMEEHIDLMYPRPYYEHVSEAASRFGISAEFIYSIMRQESAFNPNARSHMDAFGLMQLLPKVAKRSAKQITVDYSAAEDLYEPRVNIPLGSAHLRELWDKYNGDLILAAASYNASEKAILGWLKTRFRGDTIEFIEDIPYKETRNYIKLVLRNMLAYRTLNASTETIQFPERAISITHERSRLTQSPSSEPGPYLQQ